MSEADKMFDELGYKKDCKVHNNDFVEEIIYKTNEFKIKFNTVYESVEFEEVECFYNSITMQELQAINEKVKELGWLDG